MTVFERAMTAIKKLVVEQQAKYAEALRDSIEWDRDSTNHPPSALDLYNWHQIPLEALEAQFVLLGKKEAVNLLNENGHPATLPTVRRKFLSVGHYRKIFGKRKIGKVGTRLVFTHAEIMILCGNHTRMRAPEDLKKLLR